MKPGLLLAPKSAERRGPDGPIAVDSGGTVFAASLTADSTVYVGQLSSDAPTPFVPFVAVPGSPGDRITGLAVLR